MHKQTRVFTSRGDANVLRNKCSTKSNRIYKSAPKIETNFKIKCANGFHARPNTPRTHPHINMNQLFSPLIMPGKGLDPLSQFEVVTSGSSARGPCTEKPLCERPLAADEIKHSPHKPSGWPFPRQGPTLVTPPVRGPILRPHDD